MNAYELAKAQQAYSPPTLEEIIKQQADRIAELEKGLELVKDAYCVRDSECRQLKGRIAELEKKSKPVAWMMKYRNKKISLSFEKFQLEDDNTNYFNIPLYTTPQIKELSDEEIDRVVDKTYGVPRNPGIYAAHRRLARAILKKASFTCNGFCGEQECKENQDGCKRIKKASEK
jgi:hypothetical protein